MLPIQQLVANRVFGWSHEATTVYPLSQEGWSYVTSKSTANQIVHIFEGSDRQCEQIPVLLATKRLVFPTAVVRQLVYQLSCPARRWARLHVLCNLHNHRDAVRLATPR
jgi:hypothetical protein